MTSGITLNPLSLLLRSTLSKTTFPQALTPVLPALMDSIHPVDFHGITGVGAQRSTEGPEAEALVQQLLMSTDLCLILKTASFLFFFIANSPPHPKPIKAPKPSREHTLQDYHQTGTNKPAKPSNCNGDK